MTATDAGSGYVFEMQGYNASLLAWLLIATVGGVLLSFMYYLRKDYVRLQKDELMRYADDDSLVYFLRPTLPQNFDLLLCSAKDEIALAEDMRDDLHELVHTMGVEVHRAGMQRKGASSSGINLFSA